VNGTIKGTPEGLLINVQKNWIGKLRTKELH